MRELVPEFEREHPGIRVDVQQIPWTAAHEKLLTGFVGGSPPDVAQLGNTWIPEFAAIGALEPLGARLAASTGVSAEALLRGHLEDELVGGAHYGIPWYVDTRVLFYRPDILAAAGYPEAPRTWSALRDAMEKIRAASGGRTTRSCSRPTNGSSSRSSASRRARACSPTTTPAAPSPARPSAAPPSCTSASSGTASRPS